MVKFGVITLTFLVFISCTMRLKPLLFERVDYNGDAFRIDGYYYTSKVEYNENRFHAYFFYKNGIRRSAGAVTVDNLQALEKSLQSEYRHINRNNVPYGWGVYRVEGAEIHFSGWSTSVGGSYPAFEDKWKIINDTTLYDIGFDRILHFKELSPKPDSTNRFIDAESLRHKPIHRMN